jgi:hypothetical protein
MTLQTGDDGKLLVGEAELADVLEWSLQTAVRTFRYTSNATGPWQAALCGARTAAGSFRFAYNPQQPQHDAVQVGAQVTLLLHLNAAQRYIVPAVIESLHTEVDIATGRIIGGVARFVARLPWTSQQLPGG